MKEKINIKAKIKKIENRHEGKLRMLKVDFWTLIKLVRPLQD